MSMGLAAMAVTYLVGSTPDGKLVGVDRMATGVLAVVWIFPILLYRLERMLARRPRPDSLLTEPTAEPF